MQLPRGKDSGRITGYSKAIHMPDYALTGQAKFRDFPEVLVRSSPFHRIGNDKRACVYRFLYVGSGPIQAPIALH
jgi:hypothetical protein